ncbi:MAG: HAD-IC family P-type ATPase [Actinomycetota bacterium]
MTGTDGVELAAGSGLTSAEVAERIARGAVNRVDDRSSRPLSEIIRSNVLTRFNAIIAALAVVVLIVGEVRDVLFAFVMISNAVIGTVQELRSKATLDRLSLVAAPQLTVRRDGSTTTIGPDDVVIDDVIVIGPGDQIVVDGVVVDDDELTIDESLLTGEADPVAKDLGDGVLSGSFVVAGGGAMRATAVGDDAYAAKLARDARAFRRPRTELERGIDGILRVITWLLVPAGLFLFLGQRYGEGDSLRESLLGTATGLVALVPQGLVLLLSMAQAVAVIRLGRAGVLVQRLEAVETLARVTLLATDKTGTLTTGAVRLDHVVALDEQSPVDDALGALAAADEHPDATISAIAVAYPQSPGWTVAGRVPFSSRYKFSAIGTPDAPAAAWYLGAPEVLLPADDPSLAEAQEAAEAGMRVLVAARADELGEPGVLPAGLTPIALVVCADEIRPDARDSVEYFTAEHVAVKVISGDNPRTVAAIAARSGVPHADRWIDGRDLPTVHIDDPDPAHAVATGGPELDGAVDGEDVRDDDALVEQIAEHAVFGRVTPEVKRAFVRSSQRHGEVVAMTGDGVNDTLALKDADLGIAMGAGTSAAKSVAELVLLDNKFATLPGVVAEGRRVIANINRVARLFVTKTVWAATFAVIVGIATTSYPILPRQLTVVDAITIGIPGFILSFEPSHEPARSGFIRRVLRFCVPVGLVVGIVTMAGFAAVRSSWIDADRDAAQSAATLLLTILGLVALEELIQPLDRYRTLLLVGLVAMTVGAFTIGPIAEFFLLEIPSLEVGAVIAIAAVVGTVGIVIGARAAGGLFDRFDQQLTRLTQRRLD